MSCRDTIHLICWYLEQRLSPTVEHEINVHLGECADCRLVMEAAIKTLDHYFGPMQGNVATSGTRAA